MLFICLFVVCQGLSFKDWQAKYNKKYNNVAEYLYRKTIFIKHAKFVKENPGSIIKGYKEAEINVVENACAGVTKESHDAAINTMKMCQINII